MGSAVPLRKKRYRSAINELIRGRPEIGSAVPFHAFCIIISGGAWRRKGKCSERYGSRKGTAAKRYR